MIDDRMKPIRCSNQKCDRTNCWRHRSRSHTPYEECRDWRVINSPGHCDNYWPAYLETAKQRISRR